MKKYKKYLFTALAGIISGVMIAMGVHNCNRQPIEVKVERDTVIVTDTTVHYYPKPVEVTKTRTEYRWLPTAYHFRDSTQMMDSVRIPRDSARFSARDSVLVEVPITSKHYSSSEYDAWVSGYEPSLDSIKVYQKTEYITETITRTVKDNKHFFVDVAGGCEYLFNNKSATPFAELGLTFKPSKWGIGVTGGYHHNGATNTGEPYARIKLSYEIITF